jgi:hypothetical protein
MVKELVPPPLHLDQYRFLDTLDSTRFNKEQSSQQRYLLAKVEILMSLINGDGIVISDSLLADSGGFLDVVNELIKVSEMKGVLLPLRISLRGEPKSITAAIAAIFSNTGGPENLGERFRLSAWSDLDSDSHRRKKWAQSLEDDMRIPNSLIVSDREKELAKHLIDMLHYANSYLYNQGRIINAKNTSDIFERKIHQIVKLKSEFLDEMLISKNNKGSRIIQRPWFTSLVERQAAESIVQELQKIHDDRKGEIKNRTVIHDALNEVIDDNVKKGLIEIADSIYNFVVATATSAMLSSDTPFNIVEPTNPYVLAGNSLARWATETDWRSGIGNEITIPWGFYMSNQVGWKKSITDEKISKFLKEIPWEACLEAFLEPEWIASLAEYKNSLSQVQNIDYMLTIDSPLPDSWRSRREDALEKYKQSWSFHFENTRKLIFNNWSFDIDSKARGLGIYSPRFPEINISGSSVSIKIDKEYIDNIFAWVNLRKEKDKFEYSVNGFISQMADISKPEVFEA